MLRCHVKSTDALKRLGADNNGVVSLEYVIVTAFVVTAVSAAFKAAATASITDALTSAMSKIGIAVATLGGG
jgi:pilus assembly protein Flp/PilA